MSWAEEAPPGVTLKLLPRPKGAAWAQWLADNRVGTYWENRKVIRPRLILVHTNGASEEGSEESAYNYSMSAPGTTKTHYQVDRDGSATKFLPSNREGLAQAQANPFAISIETADLGWPTAAKPDRPGGKTGFTAEQAETIAKIIAWESDLWDIPIVYPTHWNGEGVASHTEPFGYPLWTNVKGKPCPGPQKKIEMREIIMPRAIELRYPPPDIGDPDMDRFRILVTEPFPVGGYSVFCHDVLDGTKRAVGFMEWIALGYPDQLPLVTIVNQAVLDGIANR